MKIRLYKWLMLIQQLKLYRVTFCIVTYHFKKPALFCSILILKNLTGLQIKFRLILLLLRTCLDEFLL